MKDQLNSRIISLETGLFLAIAASFIFVVTKAGPGMTNSCGALLDNIAYSFEQWIASASFIH